MLEIVANQLKAAIKKEFPHHKIYDEYVRQGFVRPCFFISLENVSMKQEIGNRYLMTLSWKISCYEKQLTAGGKDSLYKIYHNRGMALYGILAESGYLIQEMKHDIVDDTLEFSLVQSFYAEKGENREIPEKMTNLRLEME